MNGSIIFWVLIVLVLIALWVIHIRKCCKYINSVTERNQQARGTERRVVQTITIPVGMPPYLIANDVERGGASERKIDRELPTYEEAMEEDMRRVVNQTNISSNQPPRY